MRPLLRPVTSARLLFPERLPCGKPSTVKYLPPEREARALDRNTSVPGSSEGPGFSGSALSSRRPKLMLPDRNVSGQTEPSENSAVANGPTVCVAQAKRLGLGVPTALKEG